MFCEIVKPGEERALVVPQEFDQEPRDRIRQHQQAHDLAVPTPQRIIRRQQQQEDQAVEGRVELGRMERQRCGRIRGRSSRAMTW